MKRLAALALAAVLGLSLSGCGAGTLRSMKWAIEPAG